MLQCSPQKSHGFSKAEKFFVRVDGKKGQWDDNKDCDIDRNKEIEKKNPDKVVLMIELSDIFTIRVIM